MTVSCRLLRAVLAILLVFAVSPVAPVLPDQPEAGGRAAAMPAATSGVELTPGKLVYVWPEQAYRPFRVAVSEPVGVRAQATQVVINWNPSSCSWPNAQLTPWPAEAQSAFTFAVNAWGALLQAYAPAVYRE